MSGSHFGAPGSFTPPPAAGEGDAGSNFLSGLLSGPMDADAAKQVNTGGAALKNLAQSGGFAVNEEGFQAYIKACDYFLDGYPRMKNDLQILAQKAKMGSSEYAQAVADFNVKVAAGDAEAMLPNLDLMRDGVIQAREAMVIARKNYRETEEAHNISFAKMNKDLD
jgi:hypothetical protein